MNLTPLKKISPHKCIAYLKTILNSSAPVHVMLLHDGVLETALIKGKYRVFSHTSAANIYNFWDCLSKDPKKVYDMVESLDSTSASSPEKSYQFFRGSWHTRPNIYMRAALFFLVSISSDEGTISSGKIEPNAAKKFLFGKLRAFYPSERWFPVFHPDLSILQQVEKIPKGHQVVIPVGTYDYDFLSSAKRYGVEQTPVVHKDLKELFYKSDNIVLIYYYHPELVKLYDKEHITMIDENSNITTDTSRCEEVVIAKS